MKGENKIIEIIINEHMRDFIQYKWDEFLKQVQLSEQQLTKQQYEYMKVAFIYGYQQGYEDNHQELKEIYQNDFKFLVDIFENDDN